MTLVWRRLTISGMDALFGLKVVIYVIGFYEPLVFATGLSKTFALTLTTGCLAGGLGDHSKTLVSGPV